MSISSADSSLASIGVNAGVPSLNVADIPANVRNGNTQAQKAYTEGLAFEQVLVNQLTTQLAKTMGSGSLDPTDDSSSGSTSSSGLLGGSSSSAYSSLIPSALTSSIMDSGGLGLAEEFAQTVDPSINDTSTTTLSTTAAATSSSTSADSADAQTGGSGVSS